MLPDSNINLKEQFTTVSNVIQDCLGFALRSYMIGQLS